jgi:hypothetical protein
MYNNETEIKTREELVSCIHQDDKKKEYSECKINNVNNVFYEMIFSNKKENVVEQKINFKEMFQLLSYLRSVKLDRAINYPLKDVVAPTICELYKKRLIKQEDIINSL